MEANRKKIIEAVNSLDKEELEKVSGMLEITDQIEQEQDEVAIAYKNEQREASTEPKPEEIQLMENNIQSEVL